MSSSLGDRLRRPEYTGENRCTPCTVVNLAIAAVLSAVVARRDRRLGALAFLGSIALIYLRGYLVPGTPRLTERYLPESVLAQFDKAPVKETDVSEDIARRAADRLATESGTESEPNPETDGAGASASGGSTASDTDAEPATPPAADAATESADEPGAEGDADVEDQLVALADLSMEELLVEFDVVEPCREDDLCLTDAFLAAWETELAALEEASARLETLADLYDEPVADVEIEFREDDRPFGLVDGRSRHNWITETALLGDLAAHRVLAGDDRWTALRRPARLRVLKGIRVFLETCPACGGTVVPTDETVESCCRSWEVIAVECTDCDARLVELPAPDAYDPQAGAAATGGPAGFTR